MKKELPKSGMIVGKTHEDYSPIDNRLNKPICYRKIKNNIVEKSHLVQDVETISTGTTKISYFSPNNIAILLSISHKNSNMAKELFESKIKHYNSITPNGNYSIKEASIDICDYIEFVQASIVFGYTALETFANLSIPYDFSISEKTRRGTIEIYNKDSIERWKSLSDKLLILMDIYKTTKPEKENWWSRFKLLEQYRHSIIHQKTITSTEFYKEYFLKNIFDICGTPRQIIKFFYESHAKNNQTNPIWPWLDGERNFFPISDNLDEFLNSISSIRKNFSD